MLETELKCIFDEETYKQVESAFEWDWVKHQINYYYMDENFSLRENGIMVRVREKDGKYALQVKHHKRPTGALQICEENEYSFYDVPKTIDADTAKKITGIDVGEISLLGALDTLRHSLMWDSNTEICLDKSTYFDKIDYEIEVEYTNGMPKKLADILRDLGVHFTEQSIGKSTRFFREWLNKE